MTETERAALDALVAWRKADAIWIANDAYDESEAKALDEAEYRVRAAADRLIAEREGR